MSAECLPSPIRKLLILASAQGDSGISVGARQMRSSLGPRGDFDRQDAFAGADADSISNGDDGSAAWVAYREPKKQGVQGKVGEGG